MLTVKKVISYVDSLAPPERALPGDPVGLQLGHPEQKVTKVVVALDPDREALETAKAAGAELLITHHPLFFHQIASIDESSPFGTIASDAIRNGVAIFTAHTNYDTAYNGVSYWLAEALQLPLHADGNAVIEESGFEKLLKLVVYVPSGFEDEMLYVLATSGAGQIGRYSHCSFQSEGRGTFMPGEGTEPYIGTKHRLEKIREVRLETILPAAHSNKVVEAMKRVHPYEEVAYDLYPLELKGRSFGLGLFVKLEKPLHITEIVERCASLLPASSPRCYAAGKEFCHSVAICGGSGGSLIEKASAGGADIFVAGDFRYHDFKLAESLGLALVDAGHDSTELPAISYLSRYLKSKIYEDKYEAEVICHISQNLIRQ